MTLREHQIHTEFEQAVHRATLARAWSKKSKAESAQEWDVAVDHARKVRNTKLEELNDERI